MRKDLIIDFISVASVSIATAVMLWLPAIVQA